ncbi:MAG: cbb3-type cytochrome oxidase assembly protein [Puniceicoccaceae bacterium]
MDWSQYILIGFVFASIFFVAAAMALHWAHKNGQLSNLDQGAQTIFDDDEPMGEVTDQFPKKRKKRAPRDN